MLSLKNKKTYPEIIHKTPGPEVIKKFMLSSAEHVIFPAHNCENANNCWHFNIDEQEK